jgi:membrane protein YqaA with SNARE-associated domain
MNLKLLKNKILVYSLTFVLSILLIVLTFLFHDDLRHLKTLGLLGIFLLNFFSTVALFLPNFSAATVVAGGTLYNPIFVAIVATLGGALGDASSYVVGRSGKEIFIKNEGELFKKITRIFHKHELIIIFVLALIQNPIFDAIGILAGGVRYSFKKYFVAMIAGRIIRNLALAYLGKAL